MKKIIILGLGLILVAAACNKTATQEGNTMQNSDQAPTSQPSPTPASGQNEIQIVPSGFLPANITIKLGDTVTFVNKDTKNHQPASAPHPAHTDYPEFDPKNPIEPGQSWSFTFNKAGTWKFHDHLNAPTFGFGSITVQ